MTLVVDARWVRSDRWDGIGRYTVQLLKSISATKREDIKILVSPSGASELLNPVLKQGDWEVVHAPCELFDFREPALLPSFLRSKNCTTYLSPNYLNWPFAKGIRTVLVVHDLIPLRHRQAASSLLWKWFYRTSLPTKSICRRADRIIAVSEATKTDVMRLLDLPADRVRVVPNGVDPIFFERCAESVFLRVRNRYALPQNFILALARPEPYKNLDTLIAAFGDMSDQERQATKLVLAGSTHRLFERTHSSLAKTLEEEGTLLCPGYIADEDLPALYQMASLFAMPSSSEGFGLPLLEAMASGTPCVASDIAPFREIGNDAVTYCPVADRKAWANALRSSRNDEPNQVQIRVSRARQFQWQKTAQGVLAVCDET